MIREYRFAGKRAYVFLNQELLESSVSSLFLLNIVSVNIFFRLTSLSATTTLILFLAFIFTNS